MIGLIVNLLLGLVKLIGGIFGNSFALISDAINSWGDTLTSIVVLFALRYAQKPPDDEHPYGHSRAESVAASSVALLILVSAFFVGVEAVQRLFISHTIPPVWTLWIAGLNVVIKESLFRYNRRLGLKLSSQSILANAWDHRSDAFCSLAVLLGLAIVRWGGPQYIWADEAAAIVIVVAIFISGIKLFRDSFYDLMDPQADESFVNEIQQVGQSVPGVMAVEKLWVRKVGLEYFADLHLQVDPAMSVREGHRIGHEVKDLLIERFPTLRDVLIHLEPFGDPDDKR
jgi:cation diffusion facilitator family transporter